MRFLSPPQLATNEATLNARTFHRVLWTTVGIGGVFLGGLILLQPETMLRRAQSALVLLGFAVILTMANRRGWTRLASWGLVSGLTAIVAVRAYTSGGMSAPLTAGFVIFAMLANLLLGFWSGVLVACVCATIGLVLALTEIHGVLPASQLAYTPAALTFYLAMWLAIAMILQSQIATTIREALDRALAELAERREIEKERLRLLFDLEERVKELNLLHQSARLLQRERPADAGLFTELVSLIPRAWRHPEDCEARVSYRGIQVATPGWCESPWRQSQPFTTADGTGCIEVIYRSAHPPADEGPFLKEERTLLGSLAEILVAHLEVRRHREELEELVATRTKELQASYDRLRDLESLRDDLVHMVVHDMRSPLTVVMGRITLLRMQALQMSGADAAKHLDSAEKAADAVIRMTNDLLDVSKLEQHKLQLVRAPVDLAEVARQVMESLSGLDQRRTMQVEAEPGLAVSCDAGLVRRVLENLVSNGIKHTPVGSALRIVVAGQPDRIRVSIHDQGPGIPPEARGKIFKKFGTIEARAGSGYHSVGLGLVFCKMAVEAHGGTIGVDSGQAGGSVFWFELPVEAQAA